MPQIKEARSKCGSLENINHVPGGGDVKIFSRKPEFDKKAKPRIDAKNEGYTPQGGDVKVFSEKLKPLKVSSRVGSLENVNHVPGGGDKKIFNQPIVYQ